MKTRFGYAGKILRVDLSSENIGLASTLDYTDLFLGGRGIACKIYWDEVPPEVGAFDAENRLIFVTGPLAGIPAVGGSRWQVCGKSPTDPEQFSYCNLGGRWGAELKFTGHDGIVVQGISDKPVYLFVHGETAELRDASALWGKGAIETRETLKAELGNSVRVLAIGPAGENMVPIASLLADNDASGAGGLGATMGSKKLKAVVVQGTGVGVKVAEQERLRELTTYYREIGIGILAEYISRWVRDPFTEFKLPPGPDMKKEPCYGCLGRCCRKIYQAADGQKGKFCCGSALFYQPWSDRYYGDWNEFPNDVPFQATKLCDNYGMDAFAIDLMLSWLAGCYEAGILTDENSGIPLSRMGSLEFIEALVSKIALRDGIGELLAQGIWKAADSLGPGAIEQTQFIGYQSEPGLYPWYGPRLYITNAIAYAMEPRIPMQQLHEVSILLANWVATTYGIPGTFITTDVFRAIARRFWGGEIAADFSTYEGKALAAMMIQDRQYAKECLILCDFLWPLLFLAHTEDHVGDPTLESKLLSAVTGNEVSEDGLYRIGGRVFNLQRAILVREGHRGRDFDRLPESCHTIPKEYDHANPECLALGSDGEVISLKGAVVDREKFERMKDEYYELRRWDVATGLQTRANLEELDLGDVADDLEQRGLLGPTNM
ncbi:aldehyde ferredoxin oxidoreductase N-terminal domain-containing protein [Chloroflexota bacterium]